MLDPKGNTIYVGKPFPRAELKINPEYLELVEKGMYKVVHGRQGSGKQGNSNRIKLYGKTGTAQKGKKPNMKKNTWFTGYGTHKGTTYAVTVFVEKGGKTQEITVDKVIMAVGIVANTEDIGLENVKGVKLDRGHIVTDGYMKTGEPNVYAIGDVCGAPWLAHKASHEGIICIEKINGGNPHPLNAGRIPGCTYGQPQIASVGMTEAAAKEAGHVVRIGRFPFIGNGKAIALGEPEGLVKTVFDAKTGELLGAHMIGTEVTELIQGYTIAQTLETTEAELMETVFPHPTLSEMMHESVLAAYDKALHI
ncbi:MAG: FAD-dependent oxidoreductase [Robiginitomaculum sp.]|nr:FAD-dependent oxidoreductase [Robiginitomaculum sp.]